MNGAASISADPGLLASFAVEDKAPRNVIVIRIEVAYFQCARANVCSKLRDTSQQVEPGCIPSPSPILEAQPTPKSTPRNM
jgi:hypothetical protein